MALFDNQFKLTSLLKSAGSIFEMSRGINLQDEAAKNAGVGYRQQAVIAPQMAEYNISLDRRDLANKLDIFSRQIEATTSTQRSEASVNGISVGSQSTLSVINAGLDGAVRSIIDARNDQRIQATQRRYNAQVQVTDLENQARSAEYQAEVVAYQSKRNRAKLIPSLLNQVFSFKGVE